MLSDHVLSRVARRARIRRAELRVASEAGFSLTELIVAMGLSSIVGAMTLATFVAVNTSGSATIDRVVGSSQAQAALQAWTADLRVADSPAAAGSTSHRIEWLTPTDILFYADLGNRANSGAVTPPTMVWLALRGGQLVEEDFKPTGTTYPATFSTTPTACRSLATGVTAGSLFTAQFSGDTILTGQDLGASLATITGSAICQNLPAAVSQTDATANSELRLVTGVSIDFTISDSTGAHSQEYTSLATLQVLGGTSS
jgi:prepilin-type N-terminal cleavage/methylation domain-containing protein